VGPPGPFPGVPVAQLIELSRDEPVNDRQDRRTCQATGDLPKGTGSDGPPSKSGAHRRRADPSLPGEVSGRPSPASQLHPKAIRVNHDSHAIHVTVEASTVTAHRPSPNPALPGWAAIRSAHTRLSADRTAWSLPHRVYNAICIWLGHSAPPASTLHHSLVSPCFKGYCLPPTPPCPRVRWTPWAPAPHPHIVDVLSDWGAVSGGVGGRYE
jgi:hypothetical protein